MGGYPQRLLDYLEMVLYIIVVRTAAQLLDDPLQLASNDTKDTKHLAYENVWQDLKRQHEALKQYFDINSLLEFEPPTYYCQKCCALNLPQEPWEDFPQQIECPIGGVSYVETDQYSISHVTDYLRDVANTGIEFSDAVSHGRSLAQIAHQLRMRSDIQPPIQGLFTLIGAAKQFIHFTTYNVSHQFIGALKLVSRRIPVRGIIAGADASTVRELKEFPREALFECQAFKGSDAIRDFPHPGVKTSQQWAH